MDNVKTTTWIAFDENADFVEFQEEDKVLSKRAAGRFIEKVGTWKNGSYTNSAYFAKFLDSEGNAIDGLRINGWVLRGPDIYSDAWFNSINISFNIIDPKGAGNSKWIIRSILPPKIRRTNPGGFLPWFPAIPLDADPLKKKSIPDFGAY
jgi:hypothetical protein